MVLVPRGQVGGLGLDEEELVLGEGEDEADGGHDGQHQAQAAAQALLHVVGRGGGLEVGGPEGRVAAHPVQHEQVGAQLRLGHLPVHVVQELAGLALR